MANTPPLYTRWCNVYLEAGAARVIVARCYNHAGLQAEMPNAAELIVGVGEVGSAILMALDACIWEPNFNYRNAKRSDWPAYAVSGESSIRKFEQRWHRFRVAGANEHNVTWVVSADLDDERGLTMTAPSAPANDADRIEATLRYLGHQVDRFRTLPD